MSAWGFYMLEGRIVHVAPCIKDEGTVAPPHVLTPECLCKPRRLPAKDGCIYVHEEDDE